MRRNVVAFMSTLSGLVLLFSYHTSTSSSFQTPQAADAPGGTGTTSGGTTSDDSTAATGGTTSDDSTTGSDGTTSGSTTAGKDGTYTGDTVGTRWGDVQVQITVENGRITKSTAIEYPTDNPRDVEINEAALPIIDAAVLEAQSATIDNVSGATVTTNGYVQSLQSALDQAFA